ncbi:MAG TPA: hypothetical protein VFA26_00045 [Gemmataceae bacterium]|jgi:hypothetical protein|nr:hypothetical protein [Gemmataceae bacterium]
MKLTRPVLRFAEHCAWRAFYLYGPFGDTLNLSLGFDSNLGTSKPPRLFGCVLGWHWSISLPTLRWKSKAGRIRRWLYGWQQWFLHNMDGRYGWGRRAKA